MRNLFARQVLVAYSGQIVQVLLTVPMSILIARELGPAGRGTVAVAQTVFQTTTTLLDLGLPISFIRARARDGSASTLGRLLANAVAMALTLGLLGTLGLLLARNLNSDWVPLPPALLAVCCLMLPFQLLYQLLAAILRGAQQFGTLWRTDVAVRAVSLSLLVGLALTQAITPGTAFAASLVGVLPLGLLVLAKLQGGNWSQFRPSPRLLHESLGFGLRCYLGSVQWNLILNLDMLLVNHYLGRDAAGLYSIAVLLGNVLMFYPTALANVLFTRLAGEPDNQERWHKTVRAMAASAGGTAALALVGGIGSPLIGLVFGEKFAPSSEALLYLLPGLVCLAVVLVAGQLYGALDSPLSALLPGSVALPLNVALTVLWVPRFGVIGASLASSVTYCLWMVLSLLLCWHYRRTRMAD